MSRGRQPTESLSLRTPPPCAVMLAIRMERQYFQMAGRWTRYLGVSVAATLAGLGFGVSVQAQDVGQRENLDRPDSKSLTIDEIVVSAQKRQQALADVPMVVSVLTADFVQDAGIVGLEDIQNYIPSLVMERNTNPFATTVRIRGVGNFGNIPNFEPAVGLFVDGAFRSRSGIGMGDLLDVEQIEILHGPQGTLYGKNVTAGAISIVTKRPTDSFEGMLEASAGSDNEYAYRGSVSGPVGRTVSARLSALARSRDGSTYNLYRQKDMNGVDQSAARGQLLFEPTDRLSILAILGFADKGDNWKCCAPDALFGPASSAFVAALTGQPPSDNDPTNRRIEHNDIYRFDGDASEGALTIKYEFGPATLTSLTSYDTYDFSASVDAEQSVLDVWTFNDRQTGDTFSQELRFTSTGDEPFEWMAGAYY